VSLTCFAKVVAVLKHHTGSAAGRRSALRAFFEQFANPELRALRALAARDPEHDGAVETAAGPEDVAALDADHPFRKHHLRWVNIARSQGHSLFFDTLDSVVQSRDDHEVGREDVWAFVVEEFRQSAPSDGGDS
jgi:hypothetical protein